MARSKQIHPLPPDPVLRVKQFTDHTGATCTRIRLAQPGIWGDIPDDFHKNPVFAFQVYSTIPLQLEAPSNKRVKTDTDTTSRDSQNALLMLANFLGGPVSDTKAPAMFEIYSEQPDAFACIEHQRKEIASRHAKRDDPETLLIPKVALDWDDSSVKTGFCIVITSDRYQHGCRICDDDGTTAGLQWLRFKRGDDSWELSSSVLTLTDPQMQFASESNFARIYDNSFSRRAIDVQLESDESESVKALNQYCDIGEENAEAPIDEQVQTSTVDSLNELAQSLSMDDFSISHEDDGILVSNHESDSEPDLRYLVYVPFLLVGHSALSLEQVSKAFTKRVTSRLEEGQTVSFEFRTPTSHSSSAILDDFRAQTAAKPDDYIGALLEVDEEWDTPEFAGRLHCNGVSLQRRDNIPTGEDTETRYGSFVVVLRAPNFDARHGVEFVLADPVPGSEWVQKLGLVDVMTWCDDGSLMGTEDFTNRLLMKMYD